MPVISFGDFQEHNCGRYGHSRDSQDCARKWYREETKPVAKEQKQITSLAWTRECFDYDRVVI